MKCLGLVVVAVTACAPSLDHVAITPVPQNPTPAQRQWFWDTYHPAGKGMETLTSCTRDRYGTHCDTTQRPFVILPDHREVRDPADFAPLVAPDSRTMVAAERAHAADRHQDSFAIATVVGLVAGVVVAVYGHSNANDTLLYGGIGLAATSILVGGAGRMIEKDGALEARSKAFGWYPHDLAENLHVCFNGVTVTPCEENTPGAPPPAPPPDPNIDQLRQR
jgi:hypothetical protein